ncbi:MAG: ribonuclease H-like domain-containing protein [Candidatus Paceibacterota bacterium]
MDKIVFDIETKNSFLDVGGKQNFKDLEISVVGTYSYENDSYRVFNENELEELGEFFKKANPLIGFNSKYFDVPVLNKYLSFDLTAVPHYDIFEEIRSAEGIWVKLDEVGKTNLGIEKTSDGMEAIKMYQRGDMEKLKEYCLQDVKITKKIFDLIVDKGYLWVPQKKSDDIKKVDLKFEKSNNQKSLL